MEDSMWMLSVAFRPTHWSPSMVLGSSHQQLLPVDSPRLRPRPAGACHALMSTRRAVRDHASESVNENAHDHDEGSGNDHDDDHHHQPMCYWNHRPGDEHRMSRMMRMEQLRLSIAPPWLDTEESCGPPPCRSSSDCSNLPPYNRERRAPQRRS